MTDHADIVDIIAGALADYRDQLPESGKRLTGWGPSMEEFRSVALIVAMRLEAEGFKVERTAPAAGHSTP